MKKAKTGLPTYKAKGFRLEVVLTTGEGAISEIEAASEEKLRVKLTALGGKGYEGIQEVLSIEPITFDQKYYPMSRSFF